MSLDVYLTAAAPVPNKGSGIFIREGGRTVEITAEEWNKRYPEREAVAVTKESETREVHSGNITHNLGDMADAAGIYTHLWRPEELGITKAGQLIAPLKEGLERLLATPEQFKALNPANGWGSYDGLVEFVTEYLTACEAHPDSIVSVSR